MKKTIAVIMILAIILSLGNRGMAYAEDEDTLALGSPSAILIEASTGTVIYEKNPDEILRPASVTKIMTLLLIFDALNSGKISKEDVVTVSEYAASMGGSQVFLEPGETQTVDTMIKCISVASANDASVAMAEFISGSEQQFVKSMNERAKGLGMNNTTFVNCCGLDADNHMTTARDISLMSAELITKYPDIHNYSTIWMDTITHVTRRGESEFGLANTNKLIKQYQWATGLKTGSTSLAKCCLSATASKDGIELIAVIMAAPDSKTRFADAISLLNYGFGVCNMYTDTNPPVLPPISVKGGLKSEIQGRYSENFSYLFMEHADTGGITSEAEILPNLEAPIAEGQVIGQLTYKLDGRVLGSVEIQAAENLEKAGYADYVKKSFDEYF